MLKSAKRRGFTLIELLVVIAIIAILAAILFPVFARAREKARQTTCASNQRQIGASVQMYVQDHEETFPSSMSIWSDIKVDPGVLVCPTKGKSAPIGYSYNANLSQSPITDYSDPTIAVVTADSSTANNMMMVNSEVDYRHSSQAIASYADGHVLSTNNVVINITNFDLMPTVAAGSTLNSLPWRLEAGGWGDYFATEGNPAPCIRESTGNYAFGLSRFINGTNGPMPDAGVQYWWILQFDVKYQDKDWDVYKRMWQTFMIQHQPDTHTPNATNVPANGVIVCRLDAQQWNWGDGNNQLAFGQGNGNTTGTSKIISSTIANHLTDLYPNINKWNRVTFLGYNGKIECKFGEYKAISISVTGDDWKSPNSLIWYSDESPGSISYVDNLKFGYK